MHEPSPPPAPVDPEAPVPRQVRYGLLLFFIYLFFYAGFVLLSAFSPSLMERDLIAGLNVAVGYGMGLIIMALVMALLYVWICRERRSG